MKGILYGIGVGPGDPELLTCKAVRLIRSCAAAAWPASGEGGRAAYEIAVKAVPELAGKPCLELAWPMTRDLSLAEQIHQAAADKVCGLLEKGGDVAFLTLGDPSIYSTFLYVHRIVRERGYQSELVPGIPSFCAAAARLGTGLACGREPLHIIPASYAGMQDAAGWPGTRIYMKAGRGMADLRGALEKEGALGAAMLVERCGMEGERVYPSMADAPADQPYFSLVIVPGKEGAE